MSTVGTERCNEIDLIQQTLAGNTPAFDQLVKMHRTRIFALVLSYIKNSADAEDLTQRIFIRAYERLTTLRELDCFLPWLQQIAHNTCKDWLRRRSESVASLEAVKSSDFSETAPSAEDIVLKAEVENIVRKAIDSLKETDRKLMEAHYIEGASYDELRDESGLSYAAIANRLKRAKREVRRRVRRLLGGVMIVPGRTFIWGGFETVKLSVKAKLTAVAVTAIIGIGIGGGGVLYHHTSQLGPIVVNGQEAPEARMVAMDPSTDMSSTTYADAAGSFTTKETSVSQTSQIDHFEIAANDGVKIVMVEEFIEKRWADWDIVGLHVIRNKDVKVPFEITESPAIAILGSALPISTESRLQSTVPAPVVESATFVSELSEQNTPLLDEEWVDFGKLLSSEFSDEEWIELERLLDTASGRTTPQRDRRVPLNVERMPETPPTTPSEQPEVWGQQIDPSESNFEVSPDAMTEEWRRTMK